MGWPAAQVGRPPGPNRVAGADRAAPTEDLINELGTARNSRAGQTADRPLRTLLVDGDDIARGQLRHLLQAFPTVTIIGECQSGLEAVPAIRIDEPDLVFLEVRLDGLDGFEVLRGIPPERLPEVVFVADQDRHALRAFEVHALDYLLKPVDAARLARTLERARKAITRRQGGRADERFVSLLESLHRQRGYVKRVVIKAGNRVFFLPVEQIDWLEAADNYVRVHSGTNKYLMRETMSHLADQLDPELFVRIHRSTIVNISRIQEIQPSPSTEYVVVLNDGTRLTTSKSHRRALQSLIDPAK